MRKHILLFFFLFFSLICHAQNWLENRIETAQNIVEGEIIAQECFWKNGWIYTKNSILVQQTFKGSNQKNVEMISLGGTLDNKMTKTSGMMPKIGDVGVFFITDGEMLAQSMIKYDRLQKIAVSHVGELYKDLGNLYQKLGANPEKLMQNPLFYEKPKSNKRTEAINIESFFPTSLSAGTRSKITINGSGFGATRGNGNVFFSDARTGGATFTQIFSNFGILPIPRPPIFNNSDPELISWSDTKIEVYVPSFAGTGEIAVTNDAKEQFRTIDKLTVDFSLETAPANNPNNGVKPAVNADLINSNGTGGYTLFVDPQIFQNNNALTALSRGLNNWRCATGINIELAASQASINFGARGISTIIGGGGINNFDVISQYDFCNTGTEQAWRMEEFQIIVNLQQVQRAGIDLESQILHLLGRASQLGYVNDPKDLMYFQLNAGEQKRSLGANNTKATNFIVNQSLVVNDCGPKPMILVNSSNCGNSIEKPQARFSSDKTGLCGSGTIVFKDESKNASSVLWTFNGGNPATSTARNPKVDYSTAGIYDVQMQVTNPAGTDTELKKFYIVVGTAGQIKIDLGVDRSICQGETITLDAGNEVNNTGVTGIPVPLSYEWSNGATTQKLLVKNEGTYSVKVRKNGCVDSAKVKISFAQAKVDAGQNVVMCAGKTTQLNATGGTSYQWSPTTGLSDPKIANPIASPTKTTIYTVSVNTGGSCGLVKDSVQISIDPLPTLTLPDTTTACITPNPNNPTQQTQVLLQASSSNSPSFTYRWNTGSNQPSITVNRAGTYFVTVSNTSGCFVSAKTVVTFISAITANVQNANITLCAGEKTQLKASGGQIYRWSPISGLSDPNIANPIANPSVTTTYTVTVSGGGACVPATTQVKITVAPKPVLNLGTSLTSCEKTLLLDSKLKNASFLWSDGSKTSAITVNKSGVYKLTATSLDCNLTLTDSVKVEFISVDLGKDTVLTCNKTYTIDAGLANAKYLWSDGSTQKTLTISKSGKYMVSVTPNNCATVFKDSVTVFIPELDLRKGKDTIRVCKNEYILDAQNPINSTYLWQDGSKNRIFKATQTAWYKVSVTRTDCNLTFKDSIFVVFPKIDLGKNIETCQSSLTLDPKISGAKYLWTDAKKTTTQKLTITESGSYGITVTDTCGAVYQSFVTVVFNKIASNFSADTLFSCVNPVNLDAGNKNVSYLWNDNSKNQFLTVTKEGLYSVQMKDSCQKQLTAKVYVSFKKPSLKLNISDTLRTCADSVVLDSKIANATYLWSDGSNKQKLTAKKSGRYGITVRTSCNETLKDSLMVILIKKPVLDWTFQISDNANVQFTNNSTGENDDQYFWDFGDGNSSTERNPKYVYQKQGNFKASLSLKSKYCGNNTPKLERNINILVASTENDFSSENLQIFPNPSANGLFTIKHSFKQSISLKINDLLGKTWQKTDLQSPENILNLSNLPKGMYILEIQAGQQRILHKIVMD